MATYSRKRTVPQEFDATPLKPRIPLSVRTDNTVKPRPVSLSYPTKSKKPRLTQMTIDLGGDPHRKCRSCGMEYIPSNPEDSVLHKQYHTASMAGLDVPKAAMEKANFVYECDRKVQKSTTSKSKQSKNGLDRIMRVCRRDALSLRKLARKALEIAEKDLGAVEIPEDVLWSEITLSGSKMQQSAGQHTSAENDAQPPDQPSSKSDRYKIFLYIQDGKCIGLCLAERIREARRVLPSSNAGDSSSISTETNPTPASLGISRIWVSKDMRKLGIARDLIDTAKQHFSSAGVKIRKELVAWSQPTESGAKLARAWFSKDDGWLVYDELCVPLQIRDVRVNSAVKAS